KVYILFCSCPDLPKRPSQALSGDFGGCPDLFDLEKKIVIIAVCVRAYAHDRSARPRRGGAAGKRNPAAGKCSRTTERALNAPRLFGETLAFFRPRGAVRG